MVDWMRFWVNSWVRPLLALLLLGTATGGCASHANPQPPVLSTQGVTRVEMGAVISVRALSPPAVQLSVRLDESQEVRIFTVRSGEVFQPGDRVQAITMHGDTQITH
jgi:outer membrane lipoprotein SlyB